MASTGSYSNDSTVLILGLYAIMALYHCVNRGKSYRAPHKALPWHIASGSLEIFLFYAGFDCSWVSVAACFVHSWTALMLVKNLRKGYPPVTRPSYQAGSIIRPIAVVYAYFSQSPVAYHDAVMPIHGFVYTRALFFVLGSMGPTHSFVKNVNSRYIYALCIFVGAIMGVSHCSSPWAMAQYCIIVNLIGKLSVWAREQIEARKEQSMTLPLGLRCLRFVGFVAFAVPSDSDMQILVNDGPKIGHLPMDKLGVQWSAAAAGKVVLPEPVATLPDLPSSPRPSKIRKLSLVCVSSQWGPALTSSTEVIRPQDHVLSPTGILRRASILN